MTRGDALRLQAEAHELLARGLRAEAETLDANAAPVASYMKVGEFAAHVTVSVRTVWNWIDRGLPTVGQGRGRRVPVAEADAWLAQHRDQQDDEGDGLDARSRASAIAAATRPQKREGANPGRDAAPSLESTNDRTPG